MFFLEIILVITPPEKLRLPSSTRPPAASRCRHASSAQQHYDVQAKKRASVPHLGEGGAWKSPSRGRLAWPPALRGIVYNCKCRQAREHCNQRIGCCSPVRCIAQRTAACCTAVLGRSVGGWWVVGRWCVVGGW